MKKLRVGHWVHFGLGGADKAALNLVCAMSARTDVENLVFYNESSIPKWCPQFDVGYEPPSRFIQYGPFEPRRIDDFGHLRGFGLDILQTHRSGDDFWAFGEFDHQRWPFKIVENNFGGALRTQADARIFPSHSVWSPGGSLIPNPIAPPAHGSNLREALGLQGKIVFGHVARAGVEIYTDLSLRAYNLIESEKTALLWVNPTKQAMADQALLGIKTAIFFNPTLDDAVLSALYNTIDVFMHSTRAGETFGMCLAEAMRHGCACVSHGGEGCQAQAETMGEFAKAWYVPGHNHIEYADRLRLLRDNEAERRGLGKRMRADAASRFDADWIASHYVNIYRSVLR